MQKILFVINSLGPGGAERQLVDLITNLDRNEFDCRVLTLHSDATLPYHYAAELEALNIPIDSLNMPYPPARTQFYLVAIFRYLRYVWQYRPDIIQACTFTVNIISRLGRLFSPRHRLLNVAQNSPYPTKRLQIHRVTAPLVDCIIANSQWTYRRLVQDGHLPRQKVITIPCGVDLDRYEVNTNPQLSVELRTNVSFLALVVARIDKRKNHKTIIEALSYIRDQLPPNYKVLAVGGITDPALKTELDKLIELHNLGHVVEYHPEIHDVTPYYHAADVFILASEVESFGLVIVEAAAAHLPTIASNEANSSGLVVAGKTGWLFSAHDPQALADCLLAAWRIPPKELQEMGEQASQAAQAFHLARMAEAYSQIYKIKKFN